MDKLIGTLNQRISDKIGKKNENLATPQPQGRQFSEVLDSKVSKTNEASNPLEKIVTQLRGGDNDYQVHSAPEINVQFSANDAEGSADFDPKS